MNNTAKKFTNIATITAFCKHLHKGVAHNRLPGAPYNSVGNPNHKYAVILPDFKQDDIQLKGCFTWGNSGFSFTVKISSDGKKVVLKKTGHKDCDISESKMEKIIFSLLSNARSKLTNEFPTKRERFKEPMLQACKTPKNPSQRTKDNIEHFVEQKVFDKQFGAFLINHHDDGLRCARKKTGTK